MGRHDAVTIFEVGNPISNQMHDPDQLMPKDRTGRLRLIVQLKEIRAAKSAPRQSQNDLTKSRTDDRPVFGTKIAVRGTNGNTHLKG